MGTKGRKNIRKPKQQKEEKEKIRNGINRARTTKA